jgi:toxin-antitoxin system PIN domain toxin
MIIPDVNLLVYAHNEAAALHLAAREWWEDAVNGERSIGVPWAVAMGFIRLVTHSSVLAEPRTPIEALGIVRGWFTLPAVDPVDPGPRHLEIVEGLFHATGVAGALTTDTHLAALAIEHQAELCSNDVDFARFPGLRWRNPLA